jgi:hypothetical protein
MLNEDQSARVARHATAVLVKVIDSLPDLLARTEPENAAAVVADILKARLAATAQQDNDPEAELKRIIQAAEQCAELEARAHQTQEEDINAGQ